MEEIKEDLELNLEQIKAEEEQLETLKKGSLIIWEINHIHGMNSLRNVKYGIR